MPNGSLKDNETTGTQYGKCIADARF